ncbi:hypothetical protein QKU48_gp1065 [Fadolivirus algeromassiliense]|jgi:hypothetical protein|uniref:Uncharacterized protein n=1 Tax=Fadolivirus FV1/VV64 TaxID=3070911 RepID=A0A7D3QUX7_9VIRU|nr:hypothetical protein QKU48_gp1065 [Fadolivirus algeromassiliense]QKF94523.1 hypothetical protein Fadolivirus_1_1065 [Fadolivirus FV1/VV64]
MNVISILILLLIIGIITAKKFAFEYQIEGLTADEAVKNVSSLYNTNKLTITDFKSTGDTELNKATITNGTITTLKSTTGTIDNLSSNNVIFKGNGSGATHFPYSDGNNYITSNNNILRGGPTTIQGDLNVSGKSNIDGVLRETVNIIENVKWDQSDWISRIESGKYFTRNMPNGTLIKFLFVHSGDNNPNHPNRWIVYAHAVKYGNQFLMWRVHHPGEHGGIPNPLTGNTANDKYWRGNI